MKSIVLMMSDSNGVYIPQYFLDDIDRTQWQGIADNDAEIISRGPSDEWYWEAWYSVLNTAYYIAPNGDKYTLHQDCDLWAICPERMTNEEYQQFFGEMKPAPSDAYEFEFCRDCLIALANEDYSGMDCAQEAATMDGLAALAKDYNLIPDGAEYGFRNSRCECCDELPGYRYRVIGFKK